MLKLEDWMSERIITCKAGETVKKAVNTMVQRDIGSLIILEDGQYAGMVTEKDIMRKVVAKELDPQHTYIRDIMTRDIITLDVNASLMKLSDLMARHHLRRVPLTKEGRIIGLITARDMIKVMSGRS